MPGAPTAAGLGAALALAGLGFYSPSLLVAGIGFAGLAAVALAWVELARPRRLVREPGPSRVIEGDPYPVRIRALGARLRPPAGELVDEVLEAPVRLGPCWRGEHAAEVRLEGRGMRRLGRARLEVRDPLGLRVRTVESADAGELLVLPRIEPVTAAGTGVGGRTGAIPGIDDGAAAGRLDARAIELEVDGLRAYREGSPASRIHWPAVARTGELIERRLVAGADSAPLVVLDANRPAGESELDAAVRAAASLCVHLARAGGCAVLLPGDRRVSEVEPDLHAWPHLHARFALVEAGAGTPAVSRAVRSGAVFWVTATASPALPQALRAGGPGRRYLVAPAGRVAAPNASAVFAVAGCVGIAQRGRKRALGRAA
jgi:uncharacterized protein (DUF58 family)